MPETLLADEIVKLDNDVEDLIYQYDILAQRRARMIRHADSMRGHLLTCEDTINALVFGALYPDECPRYAPLCQLSLNLEVAGVNGVNILRYRDDLHSQLDQQETLISEIKEIMTQVTAALESMISQSGKMKDALGI